MSLSAVSLSKCGLHSSRSCIGVLVNGVLVNPPGGSPQEIPPGDPPGGSPQGIPPGDPPRESPRGPPGDPPSGSHTRLQWRFFNCFVSRIAVPSFDLCPPPTVMLCVADSNAMIPWTVMLCVPPTMYASLRQLCDAMLCVPPTVTLCVPRQ